VWGRCNLPHTILFSARCGRQSRPQRAEKDILWRGTQRVPGLSKPPAVENT